MRTLYVNGDVYSTAARDATALLVDGADVAWIGDDIAARALQVDVTVDLDGALVTPAFVDSHVHTTDAGLALSGLDLAGIDSPAAAPAARRCGGAGRAGASGPRRRVGRLRSGRAALRPGARSTARGTAAWCTWPAWTVTAHWSPRHCSPRCGGLRTYPGIGRTDMSPGRPTRRCGRRRTRRSPRPRSSEPSAPLAPAPPNWASPRCTRWPAPRCPAPTTWPGCSNWPGPNPDPRSSGTGVSCSASPTALELGAVGAGGDLFCDGSLGSHTAALEHPYTDEPDRIATVRIEVGDLAEHIRAAAAAGLQAGFHAIGDAAVNRVLTAVDVVTERHGPAAAAGHRIEHAAMAGDPARLARSGLTASMQPAFDATWGGADGMYAVRVGAERAAAMHRFADLAAAGVPLALGSDAPVTPLDPWGAIRAAVYPRDPSAGISPRAAFLAHTRGGWRAARADGDGSGTLAPGTPATLAVWRTGGLAVDAADERVARWSTDPRAAVPGLPDLRPGTELPQCLRTLLRGEVIFDRGLS